MPDPKSRLRVQRLINGDFRPHDLTNLFLYVRDHCGDRAEVRDIGDFVAHPYERKKGLVTRSTREFFLSARYMLAQFGGERQPLDGSRLPPEAKDYFQIAANRNGHDYLRRETGLGAREADLMLSSLAERLIENLDSTWSLPFDCTEIELNLVKCISSRLVSQPAFEGAHLVDGFLTTLKRNGLISDDEIQENRQKLSDVIQLFAVASMHHCIVQIYNNSTCQLVAAIDPEGSISVLAEVPVTHWNGRVKRYLSAIFISDCDPSTHCHPDLLSESWNFEIELGPDRKLHPFR